MYIASFYQQKVVEFVCKQWIKKSSINRRKNNLSWYKRLWSEVYRVLVGYPRNMKPVIFSIPIPNKKDYVLNICSQHSDINDSNFCQLLFLLAKHFWFQVFFNKKPKLLRKNWHVHQIFELILEQCVANYYGSRNNFLT